MARFKSKPVVIEAEQWFPGKFVPGVSTVDGCGHIETLEGTMIVSPGDWVITGLIGEKYPCKDIVFRQKYDAVEQES